MSIHNICFYGEITKSIPKLSSNTLLTYFTALFQSLLHIFLFMFLLRVMDIRSTGGDLSDACCPGSKGCNSVIPNNNADVNHKEDIDVAEERTRVRRLQEGGASQVNYSAWGKVQCRHRPACVTPCCCVVWWSISLDV